VVTAVTTPLLSVQGLRVEYGTSRHRVVAVDEVSFEGAAGGTIALIGESGSGKTSIARAICGFVPVAAGAIALNGRQVQPAPRGASGNQGIQLVHQNPYSALDPRWPVWKSVYEATRARSPQGTRAERIAESHALLERVGLPAGMHARRPRELSGGQCQRVTIARALAASPTLIILDEAVSALDVSVKNEILHLLDDLRRDEGLTYLFVTHDMAAVAQIATSILVMYRGHLVETGPAHEILTSPREPYTQRLISAVPKFDWGRKRAAS
jgi:peptide/nickel transport system ATP-binding protein